MKIIPIKKYGASTYVDCKVDDEDYASLMRFKWHESKQGYAVYTLNVDGEVITVLMHKVVMWAPPGMFIDHRNQDKLDQQKNNLRVCTRAQNNANVYRRRDNKSGFKGVTWHKSTKKWIAQITNRGRRIYLGVFDDKIEAARVYQREALRLQRDYAKF